MKELLELRNKLKKKKPEFVRQDAHKQVKVGWKWRKPKGSDSKMRLKLSGYRRSVEVGWGSPSKVRGLHSSGLEAVVVHSPSQIENIDSASQGAVISSTVGLKKRVLIINKANEKKIAILNISDTDDYLKKVQHIISERKNQREGIKKRKDKSKEAKQKPKDKQKLEEKVTTEEDKKEEEKKEKDKLLTKREV